MKYVGVILVLLIGSPVGMATDLADINERWLATTRTISADIGDYNGAMPDELNRLQPRFNELVSEAESSGHVAFAHFMRASIMRLYGAYDQGVDELNLALQLDPGNIRYLLRRSDLVGEKARFVMTKEAADHSLQIHLELAKVVSNNPNNGQLGLGDVYFELTTGYPPIAGFRDVFEEYYALALQNEFRDLQRLAFTWNNLAGHLRLTDRCEQSKYAAEQALEIMSFGNARTNRERAIACIEMQQAGLRAGPMLPPFNFP